MTKSREFLIAGSIAGDGILGGLKARLVLHDGGVSEARRTFLDTFDWRLCRGGHVVELVGDGKAERLIWRRTEGALPPVSIPVDRRPRFVEDLPEGAVRDALAPILEMRALMPVARLDSRVRTALGLDRNLKTVVRVDVEENTARPLQGRTTVPLPARLRVVPVKGYDAAFARTVAAVRASLDVAPVETDLRSATLQALGIPFGMNPNETDVRLDPETAGGEAVRRILLRLLDIIETNHPGTVADIDTEFLHQFRVAVRRSRAVSRNLGDLYEGIGGFLDELTWLGRATGPARDLDVYILHFPEFEARLSPRLRPDIQPLKTFLRERRAKTFRRLKRDLTSRRYRDFAKRWRAFLETPGSRHREQPEARHPIADCADAWIWTMYRTLMKQGLAIRSDTEAKALHSLRITAKKLRYNLDSFRSLYPRRRMGRVLKELKLVQDNLGTFQDREVQVLTLRDYGRRMMEKGGYGSGTFFAIGALIDGLARSQKSVREEFADRFGRFQRRRNRELFRALFLPRRVAGGALETEANRPERADEDLGDLQYQGRRRQDDLGG